MLLPRSHAWTPLQKWLIVTIAIVALALCGAGIYIYERSCRVTDAVLVGTWAFPTIFGDDIHFHLGTDHTFLATFEGESSPDMRGTWFGGGDFLYFRRPFHDDGGNLIDHPLFVWRLEAISHNELQIRVNPEEMPRTIRRVSPESP
jgi:hypothetical protein